jgi:hypothetical protein
MFEIDTGDNFARNPMRMDHNEALLDAVLDALPEDATQAQIDDALVQAIFGQLRKPKRADTVRRHLCRMWPLIAPLAEREPEQFDAIIMEFLDRIDTVG